MFSRIAIVVTLFAAFAFGSAEARTRVGVLRCYVDGSTGYVVGSDARAHCIFSGNTRREHYRARIANYGLDVGYTNRAVLVWAVYAPSDYRYRALRGSYVGGGADAALGLGGGGNVLVGGNNRTVSLQPLSISGQEGVNLRVAVKEVELY